MVADYGLDITDDDDPEALRTELRVKAYQNYEGIANTNFTPAQYRLGNLLEEDGEYEAAFVQYSRAAEDDFPAALNALGWIYHNGIGGVEINIEKAKDYYARAMEQRFPAAFYNYATMIEQDEPEQAELLLKKVAYGDNAIPLATFALGRIYENLHTKEKLRDAILCYEQAFSHGVREAGVALERCKNAVWYLKEEQNGSEGSETDQI